MKTKKLFALPFGIMLMTLLSGCPGTTEKLTSSEEPQQEAQDLKRELTLWEDEFPVKYGDPISFFNEFEIRTVASKKDYIYKMVDGVVKRIPSRKLSFTVLTETSGVISQKGSTTSNRINVRFFSDSETYVTFSTRKGLVGFYAEPNATVFVDGIPFSVPITIIGKGDGKCRLYFDLQDEANPEDDAKVADGIIPAGEKEIAPKK